MYTSFIILGSARSGSNLLASALNTHPNIICFRELFNPASDTLDYNVPGYDNDSRDDLALRNKDLRSFIATRIFCSHAPDTRAVGFKVMREHLDFFAGLADHLSGIPDLRVLRLVRSNLLRTFVSLRIAEASGHWVDDRPPVTSGRLQRVVRRTKQAVRGLLGSNGASMSPRAVRLSVEECKYYFDWATTNNEQNQTLFRARPAHDVWYDRLVDAPERELAAIQEFLDVPVRRLALATRRQNPEPIAELLLNYDELRRAFNGTQYAWFFEGSG
jgi:hypothetical protein